MLKAYFTTSMAFLGSSFPGTCLSFGIASIQLRTWIVLPNSVLRFRRCGSMLSFVLMMMTSSVVAANHPVIFKLLNASLV